MTSSRTCYIDCTNTVNSGHNTGIQRVVRNIINRIPRAGEQTDMTFVPVIAVGCDFYRINRIGGKPFFWIRLANAFFAMVRNVVDFLHSPLARKKDWPVDLVANSTDTAGLHSSIVLGSRKIMPFLFKLAYLLDGVIASSRPLTMAKGEIFFSADSFWKKEMVVTIHRLNERGLKVIMLIYDIIAITHDNVFEPGYRRNFEECLKKYLPIVNGIVSISKSALTDIAVYVSKVNSTIKYDYFYLGADFSSSKSTDTPIRHELRYALSAANTYLMVGTIEPRKNHTYAMRAFELLWREGSDVSLCIVGRKGWMCDDVIAHITSSRQFGSRLFFFDDANDDELEFCYENAKALLIMSIVEGFGLPLVEAMHYGKTVFASDIPVFREIGKEYPIYCDIGTPQSLANAIRLYEAGALDRHFTPRKWISWDESIDDLFAKLAAMAGKITQ
ncbi:MAG: glycosyltransferase family 4 protein [Desulfobacter sp.]